MLKLTTKEVIDRNVASLRMDIQEYEEAFIRQAADKGETADDWVVKNSTANARRTIKELRALAAIADLKNVLVRLFEAVEE